MALQLPFVAIVAAAALRLVAAAVTSQTVSVPCNGGYKGEITKTRARCCDSGSLPASPPLALAPATPAALA
jgi:hypothetical protein